MNMLLMGPRGCGKTSVGRLLAGRTGRRFIDLDDVVLTMFGTSSVSQAWQQFGEPAWREAEAAALIDVLRADGQIVALGGGTPAVQAAWDAIRSAQQAGAVRVAYLVCSIDELARRLQASPGDRPALTTAGLIEEVRSILSDREPIYRGLADITCDVTASTPRQVADQLAGHVVD